MEERLAGYNYSLHELGFDGNIAQSVEQYVAETRADLLTMVRYHHNFWERIIDEPVIKKIGYPITKYNDQDEPVIKKIAFHSTVPVLFLPEQS